MKPIPRFAVVLLVLGLTAGAACLVGLYALGREWPGRLACLLGVVPRGPAEPGQERGQGPEAGGTDGDVVESSGEGPGAHGLAGALQFAARRIDGRMDETQRAQILARINVDLPATVLVLNSGERLPGQIVSETPDAYQFRRSFGHSGHMLQKIARKDVRAVRHRADHAPDLSFEEYRIAERFPAFHIYQDATQCFVTDSDYLTVERYRTQIDELFNEIRTEFRDLLAGVAKKRAGRGRMVTLIFRTHDGFQAFCREGFGAIQVPLAFYWPENLTLVLCDEHPSGTIPRHLRRYIFRHEATHHFMHHYVFDYPDQFTWLNEGLAEYCAQMPVGKLHLEHIQGLQAAMRAGTMPALGSKYFTKRTQFVGERVMESYGAAWALTYYATLKYPAAYVAYVQAVQKENPKQPRAHEELFRKHFGRTTKEFTDETLAFVEDY